MPRLTLRVKPGSSRTSVGGRFPAPGGGDALIVAVTAPAVDGRANDAVIEALAHALDLKRRDISLVRGHTSRTKLVDVPDAALPRVQQLLGPAPPPN